MHVSQSSMLFPCLYNYWPRIVLEGKGLTISKSIENWSKCAFKLNQIKCKLCYSFSSYSHMFSQEQTQQRHRRLLLHVQTLVHEDDQITAWGGWWVYFAFSFIVCLGRGFTWGKKVTTNKLNFHILLLVEFQCDTIFSWIPDFAWFCCLLPELLLDPITAKSPQDKVKQSVKL